MQPVEFMVWSAVWFVIGRLSGRVVVPSIVDILHDLRSGRAH